MKLTRRSFMQVAGVSIGTAVATQAVGMNSTALAYEGTKSVLIDIAKCTGCRACVLGCKQWNKLPINNNVSGENFSSINWINIISGTFAHEENGVVQNKTMHVRKSCMHCQEAACIMACPAGAISHTTSGMVMIDSKKCIGCNYCIANCTFNVVGFDQAANVARKCTGCYDRIADGLEPACVNICPTGALSFGDRQNMIDLAKESVISLNAKGYDKADIYGIEELQGLGMIYVLPTGKEDSDNKYSLPENPHIQSSTYIWDYLFKPLRIVLVTALGFALLINRSESQVETAENKK